MAQSESFPRTRFLTLSFFQPQCPQSPNHHHHTKSPVQPRGKAASNTSALLPAEPLYFNCLTDRTLTKISLKKKIQLLTKKFEKY